MSEIITIMSEKTKNNPYFYHFDNSHERIYLNQFGSYLVEQADKDYIACRSLYRRGYYSHSASLACQSIEKYLKSILLYLGHDTRKFSHNLEELFKANKFLGLELQDNSIKAIDLLNGIYNPTRYIGSGSYVIDFSFIHYLDYFVKDIRPYAQNRNLDKKMKVEDNPKNIKSGHDYKSSGILFNGYLERVLKSKERKMAKIKSDLVWNNFYFGQSKKLHHFSGGISHNFPFNLESEFGLRMARYIVKFFKFEFRIENELKK